MIRTTTVALIAALALPSVARADQYENQVRAQMMSTVTTTASRAGYSLDGEMKVGRIRQGERYSYSFDIPTGGEYMLVANCDSDCHDVDLSLTETNGQAVAADRDDDDLAVVKVPAGHPGRHSVTVSMADCHVGACRFGLALFSK